MKLVGTKAANLARLLSAGFAVPDGVVVTTATFQSAAGAEGAETDRQLPAGPAGFVIR